MLELFHHCLPVNESKLHPCWTTAKVWICSSLELWLCLLFDILVEQITTFAILLQCSKVYQQCSPAGFPGWCKVPDSLGSWSGMGWDPCCTCKTVNLCIVCLQGPAGSLLEDDCGQVLLSGLGRSQSVPVCVTGFSWLNSEWPEAVLTLGCLAQLQLH